MKFIPAKYERVASVLLLKAKVKSPTILFAGGVIAGVGTVVLACRATLKVEDEVFAPMERGFRDLKHLKENGNYSHKEIRHDRAAILVRGTSKMVGLYGPAFVLGVTSIACLTQSHRILTKRNVALTAAYSVLEKGFEDYRGRVRSEFGEDKDREFRHGVDTVEETVVDKNGKQKTKKVKVAAGESMYARFFNEDNPNWKTTPEYNVMFLRQVQNYVNDRLRSKGYISLNDVYKELGFEETTAGQMVGWVWKRADGDGYIDFGIFDENKTDQFYDFIVGREGSILLDFNVDGEFVEWINKVNKSGWK